MQIAEIGIRPEGVFTSIGYASNVLLICITINAVVVVCVIDM